MRTQEELIQLRKDIKDGEMDENQCRDICYVLITELIIAKDTAPRPKVQWFAQQMERVLKDNDYKGGWDEIEPLVLLNRLKEETAELANAIKAKVMTATIKEAIDVANFAMMIANNMRQ